MNKFKQMKKKGEKKERRRIQRKKEVEKIPKNYKYTCNCGLQTETKEMMHSHCGHAGGRHLPGPHYTLKPGEKSTWNLKIKYSPYLK